MATVTKIACTACVTLVLIGCAKTDDAPADTAAADTAVMGAPAPLATPATGGATGAAAGPGETDLVHVPLREWSVSVSKSPIRAGQTTFHAMNEGQYTHAMEIEGNGQEWETDPIAPGGTATLTVSLTPGTYEVYCPVQDSHGNHQQRGMRTSLVVQ